MIVFNFKKYIFKSKEKVGFKNLNINRPYLSDLKPESIIWFQTRDCENRLHSFNDKPAYFAYYFDEPHDVLSHVEYYSHGLTISPFTLKKKKNKKIG